MSDDAKRDLRNVIVFSMIDGNLSDEEKRFIESLRVKLGIDEGEFRDLCDQVRQNPKQLSLPAGRAEALDAACLLMDAAAADGQVSQAERRALVQIGAKIGLEEPEIENLIALAGAPDADYAEVEAAISEMYASFTGWDEATRREGLGRITAFGKAAALPLLRVLESYRTPDGAEDSLALRVMVTRELGALGDPRTTYYLAQHVILGDMDDELTNSELRGAAAEAIGRLTGRNFTSDQEGIVACRQWWYGTGQAKYDQLAF